MKFITIMLVTMCCVFSAHATDPIKSKAYFIEFDVSYPIVNYLQQALFEKEGLSLGGAVCFGKRSFPIYGEVFYHSPLKFAYRNNSLTERFYGAGLRYNLNHLTYFIPYGIDPYVGVSLVNRRSQFQQSSLIVEETGPELLRNEQRSGWNYDVSAGVKIGNGKITLGVQYDFLPATLTLSNPEGEALTIYNNLHMVSARLGIRLNPVRSHKIKCPRLNKKQKGTLRF